MNARSIYYDPMENIIIDGIMFKKEIYSNLIPRIYQLFHKQFELFFKGDEWKHVLDLTKGVEMINWYNFDFKVEGCNPMLIELNEESSGDIEKLCALLELSLFGLGLGSSRLEQVSNISTTAFAWGYDCLYYAMTSRKRGSIKAKSGSNLTVDITRTGAVYSLVLNDVGSGYVAAETVTILGAVLGGTTPANNATITIDGVDGSGAVTTASISGAAANAGSVGQLLPGL